MIRTLCAVIWLALAMMAEPVFAQTAEPATVGDTDKGKGLVDSNGMTLYVFDQDKGGKSSCNGQCATNWPPLTAEDDAKPSKQWTIITRADKTKQWAYKRKPVYTWINDKKAGDATGDGVGGSWHIAKP
jgi:predicted lipoprotein with Yx(FWY)xxD motif